MGWLLLALLLLAPSVALSDRDPGPCTFGTDCLCDCLQDETKAEAQPCLDMNDGEDVYDASVFACIDWDHPALTDTEYQYNDVRYGLNDDVGSNVSDGGGGNNRGITSWFGSRTGTTGPGVSQMKWGNGEPTSPARGPQCITGGGACRGFREWSINDPWDSGQSDPVGSPGPKWDYIGEDQFTDEIGNENGGTTFSPASVNPSIPGDATGLSVFGNASIGFRVPEELHPPVTPNNMGGLSSGFSFSEKSQWSATAAIGYQANVWVSDVLSKPWKHDEMTLGTSNANEHNVFGHGSTNFSNSEVPFVMQIDRPGASESECNTIMGNANIQSGTYQCGNVLDLMALDVDYNSQRAGDFDLDEWHCMRTYFDISTPSNTTIKMWKDDDADPLIEMYGIDFTGSEMVGGLSGWSFNMYSNNNEDTDNKTGNLQATRRYQDNLIIKTGEPASCGDIGFDYGAAPATSGSLVGGTASGVTIQ